MKRFYHVLILCSCLVGITCAQIEPCDSAISVIVSGAKSVCESQSASLSSGETNCFVMESFNTPYNTFPGCGGNVLNNPVWFTFIAQDESVGLRIQPMDCQAHGNQGSIGIQAALYLTDSVNFSLTDPDCNFSLSSMGINLVRTQCGCTDEAVNWKDVPLVVGSTYSIVIDGCAGDICQVLIDFVGGDLLDSVGNPGEIVLDNDSFGKDSICAGAQDVEFSIAPVFGARYYLWTLPNGEIRRTVEPSLTISFLNEGVLNIEVVAANKLDTSDVSSITTITVNHLPNVTEYDTICQGENYNWDYLVPVELFSAGNYEFTNNRIGEFGCVQEARLKLYIRENRQSQIELFKCETDSIFHPQVGFVTTYLDTIIYIDYGVGTECDSILQITVYDYYADVDLLNISAGDYRIANEILSICPEMVRLPPAHVLGNMQLKYQWENESGNILRVVDAIDNCFLLNLRDQRNKVATYYFVVTYLDADGNAIGCEFRYPIEVDLEDLIEFNAFPFTEAFESIEKKLGSSKKPDLIYDKSNLQKVHISPNPTDNHFYLWHDHGDIKEVKVYSIHGLEQQVDVAFQKHLVSVKLNAKAGLYFVVSLIGDERVVNRIVITR